MSGAFRAHGLFRPVSLTTNCWPEAPGWVGGWVGGGGGVGILGPEEPPPPPPAVCCRIQCNTAVLSLLVWSSGIKVFSVQLPQIFEGMFGRRAGHPNQVPAISSHCTAHKLWWCVCDGTKHKCLHHHLHNHLLRQCLGHLQRPKQRSIQWPVFTDAPSITKYGFLVRLLGGAQHGDEKWEKRARTRGK